ncbi:hypothetical protein [Actinomadura violacea]|uniref:Halobacterial output domain-containing protein n=1 Tax=Actinomadura violacea TaxID=2819934 RepID=A0ABS3RY41_9ACTN|nr:hypothetical protein [Actinomadura violacea]MBO2461627.1 hypothetical protein [Actinomadura violacea]
MNRRSEYPSATIAGFAGRFIEHLLADLDDMDVQRFVSEHLMGSVDANNEFRVADDIRAMLSEAHITITVTPPTGRVTVHTEGAW